MGVSVPGEGEPASATAAREGAGRDPGDQLEGPGAPLQAVSAVECAWQAREPGGGRGGTRDGGLRVGDRAARAGGPVTREPTRRAFGSASSPMTHRARAREGPYFHRRAISISPCGTQESG